jgi:hypothetical protein
MEFYKHLHKPGLYEASEKDGIVSFHLQGGGFVKTMAKIDFDAQFVRAMPNLSLKPGTVSAEFLPQGVKVPCYATGELWNGWGMPFFTRKGAELVVQHFGNANSPEGLPYLTWDGDDILCPNEDFDSSKPDSDENQRSIHFAPVPTMINGAVVVLWTIGDGWTWDAVEFDDSASDPHAPEA